MSAPHPEVAVGAIVVRDGAVLLVRRGRGAEVGKWSIPGGRVEFGESLTDAVAREVLEETGLQVTAGELAWWVERIGDEPFVHHYVIFDFFAIETDPTATARAGDDAAAVQWVPFAEVDNVDLVAELASYLRQAGIGNDGV